MSAPARLHFLICSLNLVPTGASTSIAPSVPGGGGDAEFLFVPSDRWPCCALTVDQRYSLAFFFLTFSWVLVYGSDEAGQGTWRGLAGSAWASGTDSVPCGSLGGGAGGQSRPTASNQHEPMRAAQHTQPGSLRLSWQRVLCSRVPECFCNCSLIPCLSFCSCPWIQSFFKVILLDLALILLALSCHPDSGLPAALAQGISWPVSVVILCSHLLALRSLVLPVCPPRASHGALHMLCECSGCPRWINARSSFLNIFWS